MEGLLGNAQTGADNLGMVKALPAVAGAVNESPDLYHGFSLRNTSSAAPALVTIRDGDGGAILDSVSLAAGESAREWYVPGIAVDHPVFLEVTGTVVGTVRLS